MMPSLSLNFSHKRSTRTLRALKHSNRRDAHDAGQHQNYNMTNDDHGNGDGDVATTTAYNYNTASGRRGELWIPHCHFRTERPLLTVSAFFWVIFFFAMFSSIGRHGFCFFLFLFSQATVGLCFAPGAGAGWAFFRMQARVGV